MDAIGGLGVDCAGIVTEVGPGVDQFKVGDRVGCLALGSLVTSHNVPQDLCFNIPDGKSLEDAAQIPFPYCTAVHALVDRAHLGDGMVSNQLIRKKSSFHETTSHSYEGLTVLLRVF